MIFLYFLQLMICILAFIPATVLIVAALRYKGKGSHFAKKVGIIVMALSALIIIVSTSYAVEYSKKGRFEMSHNQ